MNQYDIGSFHKFIKLGQSDSGIELIESVNKQVAVRKFSRVNTDRLRSQFDKHLLARGLNIPNIRVPKIMDDFNKNSYVMQYMPGLPLGLYLEIASHKDVLQISEYISAFFKYSFDTSKASSDSRPIETKLKSISKNLSKDSGDPFAQLHAKVLKKVSGITFHLGWNHGDFSFENVLVIPSTLELVLLDFLDSPFESPFIDLGRFWLDAQFGWWGSGLNPSSNSHLNSQLLARTVIDFCKTNDIAHEALIIFTSLAVLRIYPYTKDPVRMAFLKKASRQLLEML